jgi:arylsulfatase A-like enzyme
MKAMIGDLNILYIHTHDTGRYIQPYGYAVPTPNLQAFSRQGTVFRQAFSCAPTCSPSRSALLTGRSPHSCGMLGLAHLGFALPDYGQHLVQRLNSCGYRTVLCGIQHEAEQVCAIGYQRVLGNTGLGAWTGRDSSGEEDLANAREVARYLRSVTKGPVFLSYGMFSTHRRFPQIDDPAPTRAIRPPSALPDHPAVREDFAAYVQSAAVADRCFGIVMDALAASAICDNTLVIFTTDHGIAFPGMKCTLFDGGIGVSLLLDYPGNPSRARAVDALVSQIDLLPTICDLTGIECPEGIQGVSLVPLLTGQRQEVREELFAEINYHVVYEPLRCVRTSRFKLIRDFDSYDRGLPANCDDSPTKDLFLENGYFDRPREREMLYDLLFDPVELHNLVAEDSCREEYREVYGDLRGRLQSWMEDTDDPLLDGEVPRPKGAIVGKDSMISPKELFRS